MHVWLLYLQCCYPTDYFRWCLKHTETSPSYSHLMGMARSTWLEARYILVFMILALHKKKSPCLLLRWATTCAFSVEPFTRSSLAWPEGTWPTMRGASSSTWVTLRLVFATNDSNVKNCNFLFAARHLLDNISTAGKGGWGPACWKVNSWWQASFKAFGWKSNLKTILKLSHRDDQFKGNAGNSDTPKLDKPKVTRSFNCEYYESFNPC